MGVVMNVLKNECKNLPGGGVALMRVMLKRALLFFKRCPHLPHLVSSSGLTPTSAAPGFFKRSDMPARRPPRGGPPSTVPRGNRAPIIGTALPQDIVRGVRHADAAQHAIMTVFGRAPRADPVSKEPAGVPNPGRRGPSARATYARTRDQISSARAAPCTPWSYVQVWWDTCFGC